MKKAAIVPFGAALALIAAPLAFAQIPVNVAQPAGSGVQANSDARNALVVAGCKPPPPRPRPFRRPAGFRRPSQGPFPYTVKGIAGVVAAGARWKLIWQDNGNNADGILPTRDGGILAAQNDNSDVVKIMPGSTHTRVVYRDTNTGGALAENKQGDIFIIERSLIPSVWELSPMRRLIADSYKGQPLECQGPGVADAIVAPQIGGVYFGWAGEYYASPNGTVTKVFNGDVNGIVLSRSEKRLYMASRGKLYVGNVGPYGVLTHTHVIASIPGGRNDGSTIDADGRIYVSGGPGVHVFDGHGKYLGVIPAPRNLISLTFGGPGKKTLFAVALFGFGGPDGHGFNQVYTMPMIARGYLGRAK